MRRFLIANGLAFSMIALCLAAAGCGKDAPADQTKSGRSNDTASSAYAQLPIEQVMTEFTDSLMSFPGVVSVGVGDDSTKPYIAVLVVEKTNDLETQIPKKLGGYPVHIEETGEFRSDDDSIPPGD